MADIKQNIQDFYRVAQERDFARKFQFRVLDVSNQGVPVLTQDDLVYVTTADLPSRTINTTQIPFMGLSFNIPGTASYSDSGGYMLNFKADSDTVLRRLFEDWTNSIFDDETSAGDYRIHSNSTITLAQLDQNMNATHLYKLIGVFPVTVGPLAYDYSDAGTPVDFTATLAYQYWRRSSLLG